MLSVQARIMNLIFKTMQQFPVQDYQDERANNSRNIPKIKPGIEFHQEEIAGSNVEFLSKEGNSEYVVFYIHGGGFTTGSAAEKRGITQYIVSNFHFDCIANDYRLSPENIWPCHLDDCYATFLGLLEKGYPADKFILMGESAGGTLVLSLALKLRDEGYPRPAAIVAFSSCTNQAEGFPSHSSNAKTDFMLGDSVGSDRQKEAVFGAERMKDLNWLRQPYISPYYGDYSEMPPIFLAASDTETLLDDSVELYEKLKKEKHVVEIDIKRKLCHAYPVFTNIPESKSTLNKAFAFVNDQIRKK